MLFPEDAVIQGGQFNSSNFIADLGCSTQKPAEFRKFRHLVSKRVQSTHVVNRYANLE